LVVLFCDAGRPILRFCFWLLVAFSCVVQLASVVYNINLEFVQNPNHGLIPDGYVWDWSQSHFRQRFSNIGDHLTGKREFGSVPVMQEEPKLLKINRSEEEVRAAYHVNFFPFKAQRALGTTKLFYILMCFWVVLALILVVVTMKLIVIMKAITRES
jgi:hypothetical protein